MVDLATNGTTIKLGRKEADEPDRVLAIQGLVCK
jgi:hypothetical protein